MSHYTDVEEFDYYQDVSTANFGDMLHDSERNEKFSLALNKAIAKFHKDGKKAHVLDIGTGTGLLAMLAVRHGADSVIACEMFQPVANCAKKIIKENNLGDRIKIVNKHSTKLTVGENGDLPMRANILVSEVFDTELIGEGAILTFNHAHKNLLEEGSIVIPSIGVVYGQLIESNSLINWNCLRDWSDKDNSVLKIPNVIKKCRGVPSLFDLQLSQVSKDTFVSLTDPLPIFSFDFMSGKRISSHEHVQKFCKAKKSGRAQVVFMWWDLKMDFDHEIILSCAPVWHHSMASKHVPTGNPAKNIPWRDHWMQAVFFLDKEVPIVEHSQIAIRAWHDEFSFWFGLCGSCSDQKCCCAPVEPPVCNCGFHLATSRTRLAALNDPKSQESLQALAHTLVGTYNKFVFLGDFSLFPLLLAKIADTEIFVLASENTQKIYQHFDLKNVYLSNDVASLANMIESRFINNSDKVAIVAEPYFGSSLLPWDSALSFLKYLEIFFDETKNFLNRSEVSIFPEAVTIKGCIVKFDDLWKISYPLNKCMGFKIGTFDELINVAKDASQLSPEPQPLWEYPCLALSLPETVLSLDFKSTQILEVNSCLKPSDLLETANAIAFWTEYIFNDKISLTTGPLNELSVGQYIDWNKHERQGVHLYNKPMSGPLNCKVKFNEKALRFHFNFN